MLIRPPLSRFKLRTLTLTALFALPLGACSSDDKSSTPPVGSGGNPTSTASAGSAGQSAGGSGATATGDSVVCATAQFCDDFEAQAAGAPPAGMWTASQTNGTVTVDSTRAFSGTQSVKASPAETTATYKSNLISLPAAQVLAGNNAFYGRMMFYLDSAPTSNVHWTIIAAQGQRSEGYTAVYRYGGQLPIPDANGVVGNQLMANYDTTDFYATPSVGPQTDCYQHATGQAVPTGRWVCAEWHFDGGNNEMQLWLDSEEVTALHIQGTGAGCVAQPAGYVWTAPQFSRLSVGWESYQLDAPHNFWLDDVVISQERVGCPAPSGN
jgi:hypothetical protein